MISRVCLFFFFSSRRRHTRLQGDWSSDVCSSDLTRAGRLLVVPSVKYHLPRLTEPFREGEYRYATTQLADAWREPPLLVEKDFSPTLAGDALADDRAQILRWLREVPGRIRAASRIPVRVGVKLMNARFEDAFQVEMMNASTAADALVCFNRLFDAARGVAYSEIGRAHV